jgi:hypothetical protein
MRRRISQDDFPPATAGFAPQPQPDLPDALAASSATQHALTSDFAGPPQQPELAADSATGVALLEQAAGFEVVSVSTVLLIGEVIGGLHWLMCELWSAAPQHRSWWARHGMTVF